MAITTTEYAQARRQRSRPYVLDRRTGSAAAVTLAVLLATPLAGAADWKFVPNVTVTETLTDNVKLAPRGSEEGDLVTQVAPGFELRTDGPQLKARVNYALQATLYATSDTASNVSNLLNATATATLIRDLLYVDAKAGISQQSISLFGAQSFNNVNANGNRTDVRTYSISPYLVNRFGSFATSQLRYTHEAVSSASALLSSTNTDRLNAQLNSGPRYIRTTWGLQASTAKTTYNNLQSVDQSQASANVGYLIVPTLRLTATGGYEKNTYFTVGDKPEGAFYNAGFVWTPSSRTSITATAGRRYFGQTYFLAANHRARNTVFSINYNDEITSTQGQFEAAGRINTSSQLDQLYSPQIADAATRQQFVDALIRQFGLPASLAVPVNSFTNQYFRQKGLQASVAVTGSGSALIATLFDTRRIPLSGLQFGTQDDNTKQLGGSLSGTLQLGGRSSAFSSATLSRNTALTTNRHDTYSLLRVGMNTTFRPKLTGSIEARHSQQSSDFFGGDVRENAITASVLMQF